MSDTIQRAERWLARLRPCDTGANGPMFTRLLLDELKTAQRRYDELAVLHGGQPIYKVSNAASSEGRKP